MAATFLIRRDDLRRTRFATGAPTPPSGPGPRAPLRVERFALTSNNLFYASYAASLPVARTVYVDVAGNPALRRTLRERLGENLVRDLRVGGSHWDSRAGNVGTGIDDGSSAAAPEQFLAATQIARRTADFGPAGFQGNVATALSAFLSRATAGETPWVRFVTASGEEAVSRAYDEVVSGRASPEEAYVLEM